MRVNYSEDEDYGGQFNLWQANCRRSRRGKKGQAALRELEAALLGMPENAFKRTWTRRAKWTSLRCRGAHDTQEGVYRYVPRTGGSGMCRT